MQSSDNTELLATFVAHCLAYTYLGRAFYEPPTIAFITTLQQDALFDEWPLGEEDSAPLRDGLATLQTYCRAWDESAFEPLKRDYARLFVGPNKLLAPPWESVYRSEERLMFEEETLQVRAMYRQYGMALPGDILQPDDHFGLEMYFVAHLCRLGLDAIEQDQPVQLEAIRQGLRMFLQDHVSQWASLFLVDVGISAETLYFQGLALLASGCIKHTIANRLVLGEAVAVA